MRISDWSSDVCSSDLPGLLDHRAVDQREDVLPEPEAQAHDALPDVEQRRARRGIVRVREVLRQLLEADADRRGEAAQDGVAATGRTLDRAVNRRHVERVARLHQGNAHAPDSHLHGTVIIAQIANATAREKARQYG